MLMLMNRRNKFIDDLKLFEEIASRGYALGTDFIVGHPGEGEDEWKEAIDRVKKLPLTHIHAFTYSPRDNTPSAKIKERINGNISKARHNELTELIKEKNYNFRLKNSKNLTVLIENGKDGVYFGYDQFYNKVSVTSNLDIKNSWILLENAEVKRELNYAKYE